MIESIWTEIIVQLVHLSIRTRTSIPGNDAAKRKRNNPVTPEPNMDHYAAS